MGCLYRTWSADKIVKGTTTVSEQTAHAFAWAFCSGGLADQMFFEIVLRAFTGNEFEVFVEAGEIVEAALETKLFNADAVVDEQPAGVTYADFGEELRIGFAGAAFEIPTERIRYETRYGGDLLKIDLLRKVTESIIVYRVYPVVFRVVEIVAETNGGKLMGMRFGSEYAETFDQSGNSIDSLGAADSGNEVEEAWFLAAIE